MRRILIGRTVSPASTLCVLNLNTRGGQTPHKNNARDIRRLCFSRLVRTRTHAGTVSNI